MNVRPHFPVQDLVRGYGFPAHVVLALPPDGHHGARTVVDRLPDALLVTVDVEDTHVVTAGDAALWSHSCVELFMDCRPCRERKILNRYSRGVFQGVVRPPGGRAPPSWCMQALGFPVPDGTEVATATREGGYVAQFYLPEKSFRDVHGPFRERLFIDVAVHRIATNGARHSVFWHGNENNWQYPHGFGEIALPAQRG